MIARKYQDFINGQLINENVQQAKTWLRKRALAEKIERSRGKVKELTPEEITQAESNPDYMRIKNMLSDNPGYVYPFVKFFFDEKEENADFQLEELERLYSKLKELKPFLSSLPKTIEQYANIVPAEEGTTIERRRGYEILVDDLESLSHERARKKFVDRLPGQFTAGPLAPDKGAVVPSIKDEYRRAPKAIQDKVLDIAVAFSDFGKRRDGTKDEKTNKELQDNFFNTITRHRNLGEVIQAAIKHIKSSSNEEIAGLFSAIEKVNKKYGDLNGVEVVLSDGNVVIIEVRSFFANKELNSHTSHCIAANFNHWQNYVGGDNIYNKQYYIYNFGLPSSDPKSIIGITIGSKREVTSCHLKNNVPFSDTPKYLKSLGISFNVLNPMSPNEIDIKKRRVIANKEIIRSNITISQLEKLYEDGGDPNAQSGKPLINAVSEDDIEKTKWLLEHGAIPGIGNAIAHCKGFKMIKLLVENGAVLTGEVFNSVADDYDSVKYLIDAGMDVNFSDGAALKTSAKNNRLDIVKLLVDNNANISLKRFAVVKWVIEAGYSDILSVLLEDIEKKSVPITEATFLELLQWYNKVDAETNAEIKSLLQQTGIRLFGEKKTKELIKKAGI